MEVEVPHRALNMDTDKVFSWLGKYQEAAVGSKDEEHSSGTADGLGSEDDERASKRIRVKLEQEGTPAATNSSISCSKAAPAATACASSQEPHKGSSSRPATLLPSCKVTRLHGHFPSNSSQPSAAASHTASPAPVLPPTQSPPPEQRQQQQQQHAPAPQPAPKPSTVRTVRPSLKPSSPPLNLPPTQSPRPQPHQHHSLPSPRPQQETQPSSTPTVTTAAAAAAVPSHTSEFTAAHRSPPPHTHSHEQLQLPPLQRAAEGLPAREAMGSPAPVMQQPLLEKQVQGAQQQQQQYSTVSMPASNKNVTTDRGIPGLPSPVPASQPAHIAVHKATRRPQLPRQPSSSALPPTHTQHHPPSRSTTSQSTTMADPMQTCSSTTSVNAAAAAAARAASDAATAAAEAASSAANLRHDQQQQQQKQQEQPQQAPSSKAPLSRAPSPGLQHEQQQRQQLRQRQQRRREQQQQQQQQQQEQEQEQQEQWEEQRQGLSQQEGGAQEQPKCASSLDSLAMTQQRPHTSSLNSTPPANTCSLNNAQMSTRSSSLNAQQPARADSLNTASMQPRRVAPYRPNPTQRRNLREQQRREQHARDQELKELAELRRLQEQPPFFMLPEYWSPHDADLGIQHEVLLPWVEMNARGDEHQLAQLEAEYQQVLSRSHELYPLTPSVQAPRRSSRVLKWQPTELISSRPSLIPPELADQLASVGLA